jgi:hypothetical protein
MKKRLVAAVAAALAVGIAGSAVALHARRAAAAPLSFVSALPRAPEGQRVRVQVLNTTKTRGLARRATRLLRDRGYDVVEIGTIGPTIDTSVVLDLSGHPEWAATVAKVMAPARTRARRDSSRYLDIAVLLGSTWRPPAEPFHP